METFKTQLEQKTNEELVSIYVKSQDYQHDFVLLVREEIVKRNIPILAIEQMKKEADEISDYKIEIGEQGNALYIALCYLSAILGGIIPLVAGPIYFNSKRKTSHGKTCYYYNKRTRRYGVGMLIIGVLFLSFWLLITILSFRTM